MVRYGLVFILAAIACPARATFTAHPGGDPVKHGRSGPFGAHAVEADDELASLAIAPRF